MSNDYYVVRKFSGLGESHERNPNTHEHAEHASIARLDAEKTRWR